MILNENNIDLERTLKDEFTFKYSTNRTGIYEVESVWGKRLIILSIVILFPFRLFFWTLDNVMFWFKCKRNYAPFKLLPFTSFQTGTPFRKIGTIENKIRLDISSNEHPPPHFHVFIDDDKYSFRIKDCSQLNGAKLKSRDKKKILNWYNMNRNHIIRAWNATRPFNCKVGKYIENDQ